MSILSVSSLTKKFYSKSGEFLAVDNISFDLKEGEILGLLGPNGAGKTTTIQMLLGLTIPSQGSISYFEKDFYSNKEFILKQINYTSAFNTLQGRTTVWENLLVFANLYEIPDKKKIDKLVEYFEIKHLLHSQYKNLSTGEKTRINFIKALLNDPKIILMDEPTASLDPDIADKTLTLIEGLKKDHHISILYTSHNMSEVDRICDRVIFLNNGKIVAEDTPLNLTKKIEKTILRLVFDADKNIVKKYLEKNKFQYSFMNENTVLIKTIEKMVPKIIFGITKYDVWITDIEVQKPTLEDVFLQISRS